MKPFYFILYHFPIIGLIVSPLKIAWALEPYHMPTFQLFSHLCLLLVDREPAHFVIDIVLASLLIQPTLNSDTYAWLIWCFYTI